VPIKSRIEIAGGVFFICHSCYRNHRYCSKSCQLLGYEERRAQARKKYNQSTEAILDHRDRQRRYRLSLKMRGAKKSVMDETSMAWTIAIKSQDEIEQPHCAQCGVGLSAITEVFCDKDRERTFKGS